MANLVLFGAGDIARLARTYFDTDSEHRVIAFAVDAQYRRGDEFCGLPLVDFESLPARYPPGEVAMFVALAYAKMNGLRASKYEAAKQAGYRLVSYLSSRCTFLSEHPIGDNCFILEDNTVQAGVRIGNDVTLWSGNHIGHDATIGDHCFISSHVVVSGHVRIGERCFLGVNSTLRNSISLGARTLVGAGAVILGDTPEASVYVPPKAVRLERTSDQVDL
jgi:sugar O-acyltransferase (sialic acid O-acetyltransferase NeuD family)